MAKWGCREKKISKTSRKGKTLCVSGMEKSELQND